MWTNFEKNIFWGFGFYAQIGFLKFYVINSLDNLPFQSFYSNLHTISFQKIHIIFVVQFFAKKTSPTGLCLWMLLSYPKCFMWDSSSSHCVLASRGFTDHVKEEQIGHKMTPFLQTTVMCENCASHLSNIYNETHIVRFNGSTHHNVKFLLILSAHRI